MYVLPWDRLLLLPSSMKRMRESAEESGPRKEKGVEGGEVEATYGYIVHLQLRAWYTSHIGQKMARGKRDAAAPAAAAGRRHGPHRKPLPRTSFACIDHQKRERRDDVGIFFLLLLTLLPRGGDDGGGSGSGSGSVGRPATTCQ